ncbi:hypothetical protein [Paraburkholderia aromaticivorans]|uniref:hypothetical protein n=1 Tax=Paraburkholderia aromaticivorans TaxID=2026199 RepID=UPI0038B6F7A7
MTRVTGAYQPRWTAIFFTTLNGAPAQATKFCLLGEVNSGASVEEEIVTTEQITGGPHAQFQLRSI